MIMQMKCGTSLMRNHEALSLGRSYPDSDYTAWEKKWRREWKSMYLCTALSLPLFCMGGMVTSILFFLYKSGAVATWL